MSSAPSNPSAPSTPGLQGRPAAAAVAPSVTAHTVGSGGYASDPDALRNLIVNYLPPLMNEAQVYELFGQFGKIESVKIIYDKITGESRGYGFVKYQFFFSATYAVSCLNRFEIGGKKLKVAYANAQAAKEAYEMLKLSTMALNLQQQQAMQSMYFNQMVLSQEEGASAAQLHDGPGHNRYGQGMNEYGLPQQPHGQQGAGMRSSYNNYIPPTAGAGRAGAAMMSPLGL